MHKLNDLQLNSAAPLNNASAAEVSQWAHDLQIML